MSVSCLCPCVRGCASPSTSQSLCHPPLIHTCARGRCQELNKVFGTSLSTADESDVLAELAEIERQHEMKMAGVSGVGVGVGAGVVAAPVAAGEEKSSAEFAAAFPSVPSEPAAVPAAQSRPAVAASSSSRTRVAVPA
jgi:hypothetical protein